MLDKNRIKFTNLTIVLDPFESLVKNFIPKQ